MAFNRPALSDLILRIKNAITSRLSFDQLRRSDAEVYGKVMAGVSHELHGHLQFIADQVIYDTASAEYLDRWSSIYLDVTRKPAAAATGNVTFTGNNGVVVPANTTLISVNGIEYETQSEVTITSGTATVAVEALNGGLNTSLEQGSVLSLITPISGLNSTATVATGGLVGGADIESDSSLRGRLLARLQQPPQGGADYDYVNWALEVPGVTRAWVYPQELGAGTVTVRFVRDDDASLIPDAGEVTAVQDYIDSKRPVTADLNVVAPVAVPLDFSIDVIPDTAEVRTAVQAELTDLIQREGEPGATLLLSHIRESISISAGENNYVMTTPSADVTHSTGEIPVMGTITWL
ncbi:MAG: baseplate J/gp47 family protein [Methylophilaceae bacterium]